MYTKSGFSYMCRFPPLFIMWFYSFPSWTEGGFMLLNQKLTPRNKTEQILEMIEKSPNEYYLTGSRFFGGATEKSDYDFFVQESPEVFQELNSWGLIDLSKQKNTGSDYFDQMCVSVWGGFQHLNQEKQIDIRYQTNGAIPKYADHLVHIQVVKNAEMKNNIQNLLFKSGLLLTIKDKRMRKRLWDVCFSSFKIQAT